jgi:hypothetical protein
MNKLFNYRSNKITTLFSLLLLSGCLKVEYDYNELGFSSKKEMREAFEEGYHSKQKYDEVQFSAELKEAEEQKREDDLKNAVNLVKKEIDGAYNVYLLEAIKDFDKRFSIFNSENGKKEAVKLNELIQTKSEELKSESQATANEDTAEKINDNTQNNLIGKAIEDLPNYHLKEIASKIGLERIIYCLYTGAGIEIKDGFGNKQAGEFGRAVRIIYTKLVETYPTNQLEPTSMAVGRQMAGMSVEESTNALLECAKEPLVFPYLKPAMLSKK